MKTKHLHSLLDTTYTTIGVVFGTTDLAKVGTAKADRHRPSDDLGTPWADEGSRDYTYKGLRAYTYKAPREAGVQVGDHVVTYSDSRGLAIGRVVRVDDAPDIDIDASFEYKWIVQRIDREGYQDRVERERAFNAKMLEVERVKQREELVNSFLSNLPEGSEARRLFEQTTAGMTVTPAAPNPGNIPPAPQG